MIHRVNASHLAERVREREEESERERERMSTVPRFSAPCALSRVAFGNIENRVVSLAHAEPSEPALRMLHSVQCSTKSTQASPMLDSPVVTITDSALTTVVPIQPSQRTSLPCWGEGIRRCPVLPLVLGHHQAAVLKV
jgi:hypothetical protein